MYHALGSRNNRGQGTAAARSGTDVSRLLRRGNSRSMLLLKSNCERCGKGLPPHSTDARICSLETTYCSHCASDLGGRCESCGGSLERRPTRPASVLAQFPAGATASRPLQFEEGQPRKRGGIL